MSTEREKFMNLLASADALLALSFHSATRAHGYLFFAHGLAQAGLEGTLTREQFLEMAGLVHDQIHRALSWGPQS